MADAIPFSSQHFSPNKNGRSTVLSHSPQQPRFQASSYASQSPSMERCDGSLHVPQDGSSRPQGIEELMEKLSSDH